MKMNLYKSVILPSVLLGLSVSPAVFAAEAEMDHSKHQMGGGEMDHSKMDHSGHQMGGDQTAMHIHHGHRDGGFMFEYRYMSMNMSGLQNGEEGVTSREISGVNPGMPPTNNINTRYMMSPTDMSMDMHMLMGMYGVSENITIMGMLHYLYNDMDMAMHMVMPNGMPMLMPNGMPMIMTGDMSTSGLGDTRLDVMYSINKSLTASLGLSIPTGDIDQKVTMTMTAPNGASVTNGPLQAPYPMQLGSGSLDIIPSVTYQSMGMGPWSFGGQLSLTVRGSENDNDYTLGDRLDISGWVNYAEKSSVVMLGLDYVDWDSIEGQDPTIMPLMAPTSDPAATGGTRLDITFGATGYISNNHSIGFKYARPVIQDLTAPAGGAQMKTQDIISFSYMYMM